MGQELCETLEPRRLLSVAEPALQDVTVTTTITEAVPEYAHLVGLQDVDTLGSELSRQVYRVADGFVIFNQQPKIDLDQVRVDGGRGPTLAYHLLAEQREEARNGTLSPLEQALGLEAYAELTDEQMSVVAKNTAMIYNKEDDGARLTSWVLRSEAPSVGQTMRMVSSATAELEIVYRYGKERDYLRETVMRAEITFSGDIRPDDGTLALRGSTLWVTGTDGDDVIGVSRKDNRVHVNYNDKVIKFPAEKVGLLRIHGLGGDDRIEVGGRLPAAALSGGSGNDTLLGGDGNDELYGHTDRDQLFGRGGRDVLVGGDDNDLLDGGANPDRLYASEIDPNYFAYRLDRYRHGELLKLIHWDGHDTLRGGGGGDYLRGGAAPDLLEGGAGDDQIWTNGHSQGAQHHDIVQRYIHDTVNAGSGNDRVQLDWTDRNIRQSFAGARVDGGDGDDIISSPITYATLNGGAGNDRLEGTGENLLIGGPGDDALYSTSRDFFSGTAVDGRAGFDTWFAADRFSAPGGSYLADRGIEEFISIR
ncbi:MAG: calcium-binding protein [Planctomycetota bacterium]